MKLALIGYGKMGKTIERLALEVGHEIVYIKDQGEEHGDLKQAEAAIEFSVPEAAKRNIQECLMAGVPVVSGTTGWLDDYPEMVKLCEERNGSFIYASNFSIGVNIFFSLNKKLAKMMKKWADYKVNMTEIHHTEKKDAPSGTAISLAEGIIENSEYVDWSLKSDNPGVIEITALREGDVKGTHHINYRSDIDEISIQHRAHSREGFAKGAILAAEWLKGKSGVYNMKDVLGL